MADCCGVRQQFDEKVARRELKRFRRHGPDKPTRMLIDALASAGVEGARVLDIGGGVGAIPAALLARGAREAVSVDAAPDFTEAARRLAAERGYAERLHQREGDFVEIAPDLEPADVVTLDKVLCCYHDMPALVGASASKAMRLWGAVYPRDRALARAMTRVHNWFRHTFGGEFRVYIHPVAAIRARLREHGLRERWSARTIAWEIVVFERASARPA